MLTLGKQSIPYDITKQNSIIFTFKMQQIILLHTTCITMYLLNQPISFYSVKNSNKHIYN